MLVSNENRLVTGVWKHWILWALSAGVLSGFFPWNLKRPSTFSALLVGTWVQSKLSSPKESPSYVQTDHLKTRKGTGGVHLGGPVLATHELKARYEVEHSLLPSAFFTFQGHVSWWLSFEVKKKMYHFSLPSNFKKLWKKNCMWIFVQYLHIV